MRLQKFVFALTLSSSFIAASGFAQGTGTTTTATPATETTNSNEANEKISPELLKQIKAELKAEIKQELAAEGDLSAGVKDDQWSQEQWKWSEPAKPSLNFFELDGYFRFRYDFFHNLDLGTYYNKDPNGIVSGPFSGGNSPPVPICNTDPDCSAAFGESDSMGGAISACA